jgi:phospholipid/cholesterol/gamma-HCH transport system substrate-binding protein
VRRVLAVIGVIGACVALVVLTGAGSGSSGTKIQIQFDNAFGLSNGGDLKIGGVRAGKTTSFDITDTTPPKAIVNAEVTEPGFDSFRKDATCEVRPQSLIGEYYVDCQPGKSKQPLPHNVVPVTQTHSTVPIDLINNIMRRPYRERLRLIIGELGAGLAGRPQDLNEVIRRASPALDQTSRVLKILGNQNKVIQDFITNSDTVVKSLDQKKAELKRWVVESEKASAATASRREALRQQFQKLPTFLAELQPTMQKLGALTDEQTPLLRDLQRAAPSLNTFLTRIGPFSDASRPSVKSLGDASVTGKRALIDSAQEVAQLRDLAAEAPGMAKPLRQFLQSLDNRDRSVDSNPLAAKLAPPAPDPTSNAKGKGFTGFEAFWNYVYWQTLAINGYDDIGHMLRVLGIVGQCQEYRTGGDYAKEKALYDRCNSWTGPYQPGVTAKDPTRGKYTAASAGGPSADSKGGGPGGLSLPGRGAPTQDNAKPQPGQTFLSKPQVTLPPELQNLIDSLPKSVGEQLPKVDSLKDLPPEVQQQLPQLPQSGNGSADQLLNYLLGP